MFPELREAKPDNETAAGMLARAVRHDLSSMARVRAVTGTLDQWLAPVRGSPSCTGSTPTGRAGYAHGRAKTRRRVITVKATPFDVRHEPEDRYDVGWTETRWRLVDEDTGEIVDDAQGWGYKTARNAYRAHAYKKRPKSRRRKTASIKRRVKRLMDANPGLHDEILADMVIAAKEGVEYTAEDLSRRLEGIDLHGLTAARILSNL